MLSGRMGEGYGMGFEDGMGRKGTFGLSFYIHLYLECNEGHD